MSGDDIFGRVGVLIAVALLVGCEDEVVPVTNGTVAPPLATALSAVPTVVEVTEPPGRTRCDELSEALWLAVREAPKACKTVEDCVIVGPGSCMIAGTKTSCVAGVGKGYEGDLDTLSKRWETAGCEKGLPEVEKERLACKAGECTVIFSRTGEKSDQP